MPDDVHDHEDCYINASGTLTCEDWQEYTDDPITDIDLCNIPEYDVEGMSDEDIASSLHGRRVPAVFHGLLAKAALMSLASRAAFLGEFGSTPIVSGQGSHFGQYGPEVAAGTFPAIRGEPANGFQRRNATLAEFAASLRQDGENGSEEEADDTDDYLFFNVTGGAIEAGVPRLISLWKAAAPPGKYVPHTDKDLAEGRHSYITRLSLGADGSGSAFHQHEGAFNALLAGRKTWFIHRASAQTPPAGARTPWLSRAFVERRVDVTSGDTIQTMADFVKPTAAAMSMREWEREVFTDEEFQAEWERCDACWVCTQAPGTILYVPGKLSHATLNRGETLGLAVTNFEPSRMPAPPK